MPNVNAILNYTLSLVNVAQSTTPASIQWNGNTLGVTQAWYDLYYQVGSVPTAVPVPTNSNSLVYIRNLDPTNDITATIQYQPGFTTGIAIIKANGGIFLFFQPNTATNQGIANMTLSAPSLVSCEIMVGY